MKINGKDRDTLEFLFCTILNDVLGLEDEAENSSSLKLIDGLMNMVMDVRATAKANKDWATSDKIRDSLSALGIRVKDTKDGCEWSLD